MTRLCLLWCLCSAVALAKPARVPVTYTVDKDTFEGVAVFDDEGPARPGLLVVPNWLGVTEANLAQVERLVGTRYVGFVADVYGKGKQPTDAAAAGALAGALKGNRPLLRKRAQAALKALLAQPKLPLDASRVAAAGFCFGGTTALELARAGAALKATVVFHAGLGTPTPDDAAAIKGKVLALQGADDPFVPAAERAAFEEEMRKAKVDWQLVAFGGQVHSFTDLDAKAPGKAMYDERTATRAYALAHALLAEAFAEKK